MGSLKECAQQVYLKLGGCSRPVWMTANIGNWQQGLWLCVSARYSQVRVKPFLIETKKQVKSSHALSTSPTKVSQTNGTVHNGAFPARNFVSLNGKPHRKTCLQLHRSLVLLGTSWVESGSCYLNRMFWMRSWQQSLGSRKLSPLLTWYCWPLCSRLNPACFVKTLARWSCRRDHRRP